MSIYDKREEKRPLNVTKRFLNFRIMKYLEKTRRRKGIDCGSRIRLKNPTEIMIAKTHGPEIVTTDWHVFTEEGSENKASKTLCLCIQNRSPEDSDYRFLQEFVPIYWITECLFREFIGTIFTAGVNINLNFISIILRVWINIAPSRSHILLYVSEKENLYDVVSRICSYFRIG